MKGASWPPGPIVRWYAVWLLCVAMNCIRVASTQERLEEMAAEFPHVDVFVVVGTQHKKVDAPITEQRVGGNQVAYQWGWSRGRNTNKSTGITMLLHKRWNSTAVMQLWVPPVRISGRGVAIRSWQGTRDVSIAATHYPPPSDCKEYKETCGFIATDFNDGLGVVVQHNMKHDLDSGAVGSHGRSLEHSAAAAFREVLETHGMCVINTYYRTAPTYYGETQATYIDHVAVPLSLIPWVHECRCLRRSLRRLQLIKTKAPRDREVLQGEHE